MPNFLLQNRYVMKGTRHEHLCATVQKVIYMFNISTCSISDCQFASFSLLNHGDVYDFSLEMTEISQFTSVSF